MQASDTGGGWKRDLVVFLLWVLAVLYCVMKLPPPGERSREFVLYALGITLLAAVCQGWQLLRRYSDLSGPGKLPE
jgi:hypothetical protein